VAAVPPSDSFNNNRNNFGVIEGPVWVGNALYVSEIATPDNVNPPLSRLLKVDAAGGVSIVLSNSGTNGMAVDSAGNLVAGNHKDGAVTRFALPSLATTAVVSTFGGARFDSPNDLTVRSDGSLYFTDPDWQASLVRPQTKTRIYRVAPGATTATVLDETRLEPNGITFSPDGNTLYVTGADGLFRYNVAADGSIGTGTKILPSIGVGDGMAIDCAGNLYVAANASNTLVVVDPAGNMLGTITIANVMGVTNAAFGGADHKTLYITTLGTGSQFGLFSLAMNVPGFPY
jgi:gluconolactonase